jgi:hypothetical protein
MGGTAYVKLVLEDSWGYYWVNYYSDGTSSLGSYNHASVGYVKGKVVVSINDTGNGAYMNQNNPPTTLGAGDFNATVKISKH